MDISTLNLSPVLLLLAIGTITGVVECIKRFYDGDTEAGAIIIASGVIGALLGGLLPFNADFWMSVIIGIVVGFSATGYVTLAKKAGGA